MFLAGPPVIQKRMAASIPAFEASPFSVYLAASPLSLVANMRHSRHNRMEHFSPVACNLFHRFVWDPISFSYCFFRIPNPQKSRISMNFPSIYSLCQCLFIFSRSKDCSHFKKTFSPSFRRISSIFSIISIIWMQKNITKHLHKTAEYHNLWSLWGSNPIQLYSIPVWLGGKSSS